MAKEETAELIVVEKATAVALFENEEAVTAFFKQMDEAIATIPTTTDTKKDRDQIRSAAHQVSRLKTKIDDFGAELVEDLRVKVKAVDAKRKEIRDQMDERRDAVRDPLTKWEEAEKKRVADIKDKIELIRNLGVVPFNASSADIQARIDQIPADDLTTYAEFMDEAKLVLESAFNNLVNAKAVAVNAEREREEVARQKAELAAREAELARQREEEQRIAAAAERERREREEAEERERKARLAEEERIRQEAIAEEHRKLAAEREEFERQRAAAQAEIDRKAAEERAAIEAERAELQRQKDEADRLTEEQRQQELATQAVNNAAEPVEDASGLAAMFDAIPLHDQDDKTPAHKRGIWRGNETYEFLFDVDFDLTMRAGSVEEVIVPREEIESFFMWLGDKISLLRSEAAE